MNKFTRAGILALILAIPALVLFLLYGTGKNYYKLPVFFATDSTQEGGHYVVTNAHTVPSFQFKNQFGKDFSSQSLNGKIVVADFFFTTCPGICPKMTTQLSRVQEAFKENTDFRIVSFTVDPERDSVEALKRYADEFKADPTVWTFLTGNKDSIYTIAQKGFFVSALKDTSQALPDFIHSDKLILIDKRGWIRGYYNGTDRKDVDRLIREIQVLVYSYEHKAD